jgi:DNA mismatch repair protein MutL
VPAFAAYRDPVNSLRALAAELVESSGSRSFAHQREELLALVACHAAIKAGESLSPSAAAHLVDQLLRSQAPSVCPHGDPIILYFPRRELDRQFKR